MSDDKKIQSMQKDGQIFQPDTSMQAQAWIKNMDDYEAANKKALDDPEGYWGDRAKELITWFSDFDSVFRRQDQHLL